MNVLYRPINNKVKGKYNIIEYNTDNPDKMIDMPLAPVLSSMFFFYNLGIELCKHTIVSLPQLEEELLQKRHNLGKSGDGIAPFMLSLEETLQDLRISLN